jgi:hypothetical protein
MVSFVLSLEVRAVVVALRMKQTRQQLDRITTLLELLAIHIPAELEPNLFQETVPVHKLEMDRNAMVAAVAAVAEAGLPALAAACMW